MTSEEAIRELKIFSGTTKTRLSANFWKALEMAIKALSEEPCEDAVSRRAVLDGLASIAKARAKSDAQKSLMGRVMFFTEHLPPATPAQNWIPVSERLPKPYTYVNATCRSLVDDRENWVIETMYLPIPKENNEQGYSDWGNIPMLNWGKAEVIAWTERIIPEPYKESEGQ